MDRHVQYAFRVLALDVLVMLLCASNIPSVIDRARFPATTIRDGSRTLITGIDQRHGTALLQPGDVLMEWNGTAIARPEHVEFLADRSSIGATISLTLEREGSMLTVPVALVSFASSLRFALVYTLTGFVILSIALFLFLKRPNDPTARALHDALIGLGALTLFTQGAIDPTATLSYVHRAGLFTAYALTPALFLRWTLIFPVRRIGRRPWPHIAVLISGAAFAVVLSWLHLLAMTDGSPDVFDSFQGVYEWFHLYFALMIVSSLGFLAAGYARESSPDRRAALRWILWGALVGAAPFTLLVALPQTFGPQYYLTEEVGLVFVLALPVCLTVAFLRYRAFHLQIQVYRQLASITVGAMTGAVSVLISLVLASLAWEQTVFDEHFEVVLAVAFAMVLMQPARAGIRRLLEESLYPARGQLARVLQRATARFRTAMSPDQLGTFLLEEIEEMIPGISCEWSRVEGSTLVVIPHSTGQNMESVEFPPAIRASFQPRALLFVEGVVEGLRSMDRTVEGWLRGVDADLALAMRNDTDDILAVVLGQLRKHRHPLKSEEAEAFLAIASAAAESLGRLHLQELMILEQQARRRSDELSRLKSHFVSSVSHDLRTPLTSISMFGEMMQDRRLSASKRTEYAGIIVREADRLGRMVSNVLNFAKIERGTREYVMKEVDPVSVARGAVRTMAAHTSAYKAVVKTKIPRRLPLVMADADALQDVLINLISNALKYSTPPRSVRVEASAIGIAVEISVRDRGIGIPSSDLPRLFEPFFRGKDPAVAQVGGAGLGLALVKHAIDAHGGTVSVESTVGRGTTVTINLPQIRNSKSDPSTSLRIDPSAVEGQNPKSRNSKSEIRNPP